MKASGGKRKKADGPRRAADLRLAPLMATLTDDELARAFEALELCEARARKGLSYAADIGNRVGFVWSGRFRITAHVPGGPPVTLGSLSPGDAFGFAPALLKCEVHESVRLVADQAGSLLLTAPKNLLSLRKSNPAFADALIEHLARYTLGSVSRLFEALALDVRSRLCAELLRLCEGAENSCIINPAPTHASLGARIGAAREVVTRHLSEMQSQGLVNCTRGTIKLTHLSRLEHLARAPAGQHLFKPCDT